MAGDDSTCWHVSAFKAAIKDLSNNAAELSKCLRVADDEQPYAVGIPTFRGPCAAAFDGVIYSLVVATRRRDIKCIAVGCRSSQRRCHHTSLVRDLDRFAQTHGDNDDNSDVSSDDEAIAVEEDVDHFDEDELVSIAKEQQKRNLVSCCEEDKQGFMWARTAEWAAVKVPAAAIFSSPRSAVDDPTVPPAKPPTLVGRMAELGLAFDPLVVLHEKRCYQCGAARPDDNELDELPALLV